MVFVFYLTDDAAATGAVFPKAIQFSTSFLFGMAWFRFFSYRLHFKCFRESERKGQAG